jgi:SAM-dependent methyltransferase
VTLVSQQDKAERFLALHHGDEPLLLPNPWDEGSAKLLAFLGFSALATTSGGFAATLGRLDGTVSRDEALAHAARIVDATDLPVSADLENGFADEPTGVAQTVELARAAPQPVRPSEPEPYTAAVGVWREQVVPRLADVMLGTKEVRGHRQRVVSGLRGAVVEIGFGSGLNVPLYPKGVETVYAVDPSAVGRRLAAKRVASSPVPIQFVGLDGQELPLGDESVDAALSTFTLCTIPEVTRALSELHRVLRPGGRFHFLEHGLAPEPATARWQHRLNGLQQRLAAGCNLDRPMDRLVRGAGFEIAELHNDWLKGPRPSKPWGYLYEGLAIKPAAAA